VLGRRVAAAHALGEAPGPHGQVVRTAAYLGEDALDALLFGRLHINERPARLHRLANGLRGAALLNVIHGIFYYGRCPGAFSRRYNRGLKYRNSVLLALLCVPLQAALPEHPRLLFNRAGIEALQQRVQRPEWSAQWKSFRSNYDAGMASPI